MEKRSFIISSMMYVSSGPLTGRVRLIHACYAVCSGGHSTQLRERVEGSCEWADW